MSDEVTLAQIVAALSVTYRDEGVLIWLTGKHKGLRSKPDGNWPCSPQEYIAAGRIAEVADAVRRIGDADPADFVITAALVRSGGGQPGDNR